MRTLPSLLLASLLLASCAEKAEVPKMDTATPVSSQGSSTASHAKVVSAPSSQESSGSPQAVTTSSPASEENDRTVDGFLDRSFVSGKWGVSLRYPSTLWNDECAKGIPVFAHDASAGIEFTKMYALDAECKQTPIDTWNPDARIATIHLWRAGDRAEAEDYLGNIFPSDCEVYEESLDGDSSLLFLRSKNPPTDAPDPCAESFRWNRDARLAYFSTLGSKSGGGYKWPSPTPLESPDGSTEFGYDFRIMESMRFPGDGTQAAPSEEAPMVAPPAQTLPLKFFDLAEVSGAPLEKENAPTWCQPTYFQPKEAPDADSFNLTINGKSVGITRSIIDEDLGVSFAPFRIVEYLFEGEDGCRSAAIEVLKDGKHHALYTHLISPPYSYGPPGWQMQPGNTFLKIHNVRLEEGKWIEQVRLIDLETKEAKALPLDDCYLYGVRQEDGSMLSSFMEPVQNGPTIFCSIAADGTPLVKVHPVGFGGSTMFSPRVDKAKRLFVATDINRDFTGLGMDPHALILVNLDDTNEWAIAKTFATESESDPQACFFYNESPEFDLSEFSFAKPSLRYRYHRNETPCLDPWTWSEWKTISPQQFVVHLNKLRYILDSRRRSL